MLRNTITICAMVLLLAVPATAGMIHGEGGNREAAEREYREHLEREASEREAQEASSDREALDVDFAAIVGAVFSQARAAQAPRDGSTPSPASEAAANVGKVAAELENDATEAQATAKEVGQAVGVAHPEAQTARDQAREKQADAEAMNETSERANEAAELWEVLRKQGDIGQPGGPENN
ncbi:MAG: hypothetical protein AAF604_23185 [Acidobacteriota bacterium]